MNKVQKIWRLITVAALLAGALNLTLVPVTPAYADSTAQTLPFTQNWTDGSLLSVTDDWSGVSGIVGYRGDSLTAVTGVDPQTVLADDTPGVVDINVDQANPNTNTSGGLAEFTLSDPVVALQGSGTADAPYLLIAINTTGQSNISVAYNLRDIDGSTDNAVQSVALQYRVGSSGTFTNLPSGYVADATTGPSLATLVTPVSVTLPAAADNQSLVQLRIITTNAASNDEWVGIDDISITSGPVVPTLSINDVTLAEGNSGTTAFSFTVALSSPAPAGGVTFDIATTAGTATANNDYETKSLTAQTIPAGSSNYTFDVNVNGDTSFELDETFFVDVTSVVGATVTDGQGQGTIQNDDVALPVLSINDVTIAEGNSGATIFGFVVTLDAPAPAGGVTFDIATADGTATTTDSDYAGQNLTTQTISAGSTTYNFDVTVNGDTNIELTETFDVNVTNVTGATVGDGAGLGTITNDDAATPNLSINDVSMAEGDSGTQSFTFTVSLDIPALAGGVTFNIATSDGTAMLADNDYVINSATPATIPEGASSHLFHVTVNGDTTFELDESFNVTVTNVTGANVTDGAGVGTIENDDVAPPNLSIADVTLAEGNTGTTTFGFVVTLDSPAPSGGVTFNIATSAGTATAGTDYVTKSLNSQTIAAGSTTYNFDVTVNGDWDNEPNETFNVAVTSVTGAVVLDGAALGTINNDDSAVTLIHDIQGSGSTSASGTFTVDAIVVGDYQAQTSGQLKGFFVQEEDSDIDANPATSEGIFVYCLTCPTAVSVGDKVRVTGATSEYFLMSQINAITAGSVSVLSSDNPLPTPASLTLPIPGVPTGDLAAAETFINAYYEAFEGMLVKFPATLSVSEYFELARYGQVILSAGGRPHTFTAVNIPTASGYIDHQIDLAARSIILDDPDNRQNRPSDVPNTAYYYPVPGLSTTNYFRGGDTIANLTGVLHWSYAGQTGTDAWRIRPVTEKYSYAFTPVNTRPAAPTTSGRLKVASFNVLNYFLTIDTTNVCAPTLDQDCRGADSAQELSRQRTKMLAALSAINADVFGFMEMENTPGVEPLADIVAGLPGYGYIDTGVIGTDAIRVGIIYKTSTVTPVGDYAILDSSVDPDFIDTRNRPALAQTFEEIATGERFTVVVNHLKSKGSSCGVGDDDTTTGQGNCNLTRTLAAQALADWLATDPTGAGDPDYLIIGDLNSYAMEDPIVALQDAGYTDMVADFGGADAYGYVYDGQLGYLDHALANPSLKPQVAGVAEWHINADEIPLFDYNDDERTADEATYEEESDVLPLYEANEFRTSDHDPIIIGLNLDTTPPIVTVPANMTVEATGPSGAVVTFSASATDETDPLTPAVTCVPPSGSTFPLGVNTVNCSATDTAGNIGVNSFTITVTAQILTDTFYSNGTYDGWVLSLDGSSGIAMDSTATTFRLGDATWDQQYRSFLHFNTSSLPNDAVITKVTLQIRKQGVVGTDPFTILGALKVDMAQPFFGLKYGLELGDFDALAGKNGVGIFSATPVNNWYSALFSTAGQAYINKTGATQFRLRFAIGDNNDNGADYMRFFSGDYATVSVRPMLIIEYYLP